MKAVRIHAYGDAKQLKLEDIPRPIPQPHQALVKIEAIGINFGDVLIREGHFRVGDLPFVLGAESSGTVVETGRDFKSYPVGTRIGIFRTANSGLTGGYAEYALVDAQNIVALPDYVSSEVAVGLLTQGLTAALLLEACSVKGKTIFIHGASGGVGSLLIQLARLAGAARIIAGVSHQKKVPFVERLDEVDHVVTFQDSDWFEQLQSWTPHGLDVVFDSAGHDISRKSFSHLAHKGTFTLFGTASLQSLQFGSEALGQIFFKNQTIRGFALPTWMDQALMKKTFESLCLLHAAKKIRVFLGDGYSLEHVVAAHEALSNPSTTGKLILKV